VPMALPSISGCLGVFCFETFLRSACLEWLYQTLAAMQDIWMSLHSIRSRLTSLYNLFMQRSFHDHSGYPRILDVDGLRPSLAHLQGLPEINPAKLLAAMLGDLGVSSFHLIKTMIQFSSLSEHKTSHVVCFNARELLECIFDALLFFSSYLPVGKLFLITSLLNLLFSCLSFFGSSYRSSYPQQ
jgi:hypothetical protein